MVLIPSIELKSLRIGLDAFIEQTFYEHAFYTPGVIGVGWGLGAGRGARGNTLKLHLYYTSTTPHTNPVQNRTNIERLVKDLIQYGFYLQYELQYAILHISQLENGGLE
jgi:hypothetical protein